MFKLHDCLSGWLVALSMGKCHALVEWSYAAWDRVVQQEQSSATRCIQAQYCCVGHPCFGSAMSPIHIHCSHAPKTDARGLLVKGGDLISDNHRVEAFLSAGLVYLVPSSWPQQGDKAVIWVVSSCSACCKYLLGSVFKEGCIKGNWTWLQKLASHPQSFLST